MSELGLSPAARAFDSVADTFDERFDPWQSVAAQRRAVRAELARAFKPGSKVLEVGGGTGGDALWLARHGRDVVLTDISPNMVRQASAKFAGRPGLSALLVGADELEALGDKQFDGAFSNFAGLNCIDQLGPFARGLARLIKPGGAAILVVFGTRCPGEWIVEALRGRPAAMFRRFSRKPARARLNGHEFHVRYHRASAINAAMAPWFDHVAARGIGVFVPPSAAEPWITRHPHLLASLEALDRSLSIPLAPLGDHVLHRFVRRIGN